MIVLRTSGYLVAALPLLLARPAPAQVARGYSIPIVDLDLQSDRQVVVDREPGQYLGHPTTVLLEDGKTLLCVYPKGHGRGPIVYKRSADGGRTWSERLPTPMNWETSLETPTIHRVVDAAGKKRLILFSGLYPIRMAVSEDDGARWSELRPIGDFGGIVAMGTVIELKSAPGHYLALFHDDGRFFANAGKSSGVFTLFQTLSRDGGLTWSKPEEIFKSAEVHLCEPGSIRSPDGKQIAVLLRENRRKKNSHVIFSGDEGKTWSAPRELPGSLTGDRHTGQYGPDGRLFISFRDNTLESPTKGDWVGWVGTFDDIVAGREGQYRVRLKKNHKGSDCAYPGVEILPDDTFVTTTYGHWTKGELPYILSVRLTLAEIDALAKQRRPLAPPPDGAAIDRGGTDKTSVAGAGEPPSRPNIVLIVADDLGYADIGVHGCKDIPTPHIDALAKSGVRCTNGYVSHPFCSPTRAGLLTGRYQQRFGHENNPAYLPEDAQVGLPLTETTLADMLRQAGYSTGAVGKWHLGAAPQFHPLRRGFQEYFGLIGGGHDYFQHNFFKEGNPRSRAEYFIPLQRQTEPVEEADYLTDALAREGAAFIERHRGHPFFLYLAFNAPHTPLQAPEKYLDRVRGIDDEKRRTYGAMICGLDDAVGRIRAKLREHQLDRNTLVFFVSDNGGPISVTNSSNVPLRGAKGQVYEGGIRVPFLVSWPAKLAGGTVFDAPVIALDLLPTAAAAAGASFPAMPALDGVNLLPHLSGSKKGAPHEHLFWRTGGGATLAVRQGDLKLVRPGGERVELYDLGSDIGEQHDLASARPDDVSRLSQTLDRWNAELVAPRWQNPQGGAKKKAAAASKRPQP